MNYNHHVSTRLNDKEFDKLQVLAKKFHKSKALVLRSFVDGGNGMSKYQPAQIMKRNYEALDKLSQLYAPIINDGNLLNQIAKAENINGYADIDKFDLDRFGKLLKNVSNLIKKVVN